MPTEADLKSQNLHMSRNVDPTNLVEFEDKDIDILQEYSDDDRLTSSDARLSLYIADASVISLEKALREVEATMAENKKHHRTHECNQLLFSARTILSLRADVCRGAWDLVAHTIDAVRAINRKKKSVVLGPC